MTDPFLNKLWTLIEEMPYGMLVTLSPLGRLKAVPMTTQRDATDERLWFFAARHSAVATAVRSEPQVNVCYANAAANTFVSVTGRAELVEDAQRKRRLWSREVEAWFDTDAEDSSVVLIAVQVVDAEYWKPRSKGAGELLTLMRSVISGSPRDEADEHGHMDTPDRVLETDSALEAVNG